VKGRSHKQPVEKIARTNSSSGTFLETSAPEILETKNEKKINP
jgi:hypothetical protein